MMMSFALFVCSITLFLVLMLFGNNLIKPLKTTIDTIGVSGKVIVSSENGKITNDELDIASANTNAGFYLLNKDYSEFVVNISKKSGMLKEYDVNCIYSPYEYNLKQGNAVLVLPKSNENDKKAIVETFINAKTGINHIDVKTTISSNLVKLYLSHDDASNNGLKIKAINSTIKIGETKTIVYAFEKDETIDSGKVSLVNSNTYQATKYSAVFSIKSNKSFEIIKDSDVDDARSGNLIVKMNPSDYEEIFDSEEQNATLSVLYYSSDKAATSALNKFPDGMMGMLSTSKIYVQSASDIYTMNVIYYIALIAVCILFASLISVIFGRSVKVFQTDFAVYKTLGISSKISSRSLYVQMLLIFLPTTLLLPLVSFVSVLIPGSGISFISVFDYIFIEIMLLLIVEFVAFGFNRVINAESIRKSLRRGSKG